MILNNRCNKSSELISPAASGLLQLPTELLLQILTDLDEVDLHSLSLLSRRFHYVALPILLSRQGISDPTSLSSGTLSLSGQKFHALPALRMSLFVSSIKRLSCKLNYPDPERAINSLKRLVLRLSHIEEATVDLGRLGYWYAIRDRPGLRELLEAFANVCSNLTVNSDLHVTELVSLQRGDRMIPAVVAPHRMGRFGALVGRSRRYITEILSAVAFTRPTLEVFNINTTILFEVPVLYEWTMATLNASRLVSLTMRQQSRTNYNIGTMPTTKLYHSSYDTIFMNLSIPTLREFSLHCRTSFDCLAHFLSRHRNITNLTIGNEVHHPNTSRRLPTSFLSNLTSLHASPECIVHLLKPSHALPNLRFISVLSYIPIGPCLELAGINYILSSIAHRIRDTVISLRLLVVSDLIQLPYIDEIPDSQPDNRFGCWLDHVTSIRLELATALPFTFGGDALHFLPGWLAGFPRSLEHVSLVGAWFASTEQRAKVSLVRLMCTACPRIQTVALNDEERTTAAWLADGG